MRLLIVSAGRTAQRASNCRSLARLTPNTAVAYTVTALPGDGIGPENLEHVQRIFKFAHVPVDFEILELSSSTPENDALQNAITSIKRNGLAIKGNVETKFDDPSRNVELRRSLDLFANVLHVKSIPTIPSRHKDLDIVLIRENTEGEYSGLEYETVPGIVTRKNIERIARFAFDYAKITAIHKANIQKLGDGLFLRVCKDIHADKKYAGIAFDAMIVDNASMQLVSKPSQFNQSILLMPNLYGRRAVFETATRNTGSSLAGQDRANPTAFVRASIDLLRYLELHTNADQIEKALYATLVEDKQHTADVGGTAKASDVIQSLLNNLKEEIN
ncbi:Isocitrate dehydrogenase [NAD] subunit, mitochondrial [Aphelenchoides fujianensis]|nr:Isocitrate dehydrogenase [NAD] subunit, mitochondrial [Aphelenchoides fujianensis]